MPSTVPSSKAVKSPVATALRAIAGERLGVACQIGWCRGDKLADGRVEFAEDTSCIVGALDLASGAIDRGPGGAERVDVSRLMEG